MKYVNKRNHMVAEIVKTDDKAQTVFLKFENGNTTVITNGTFKRWWKPLESTEESIVEEESETEIVSYVEKDLETPESKEVAKPEKAVESKLEDKPKKERKPKAEPKVKTERKPKTVAVDYETILDCIKEYMKEFELHEHLINAKNYFIIRDAADKSIASVNYGRRSVRLNCKSTVVEKLNINPDATMKNQFDNIYIFTELTNTATEKIKTLLMESKNFIKPKKTKKEEK